ncbi:helix-turn-helix transcriptional regulator [Novosphingopyxis sp.]|uniref:helix-turn-helix transcriptional regulator n=1 Tax=Novosphingopyxis sp. TaxID=2709690 RepID=UPI003B5C08E7
MIELWSPYDGRQDFASVGRISLIKAFANVVRLRLNIEPHELSSIFAAPSDDAENDCGKDLVGVQAHYLVDDFLSGAVTSFARPIGGGDVVTMLAKMWELDDYMPRFATGALNLERWSDPDAKPTHHIFVDKQQFEQFLMSLPADDELSDYQLQCLADRRLAIMQGQQNERASGDPSLDVNGVVGLSATSSVQDRLLEMQSIIALCGCQKSKIYAMIKGGEFPQQVSVGGKSLWSEKEINQWVEQHKDKRP